MRFPFRVTDRKALKGCLPFIWKTHPVWIKSRRAWNWWKNKKDVNGTKFTGWNVPIGKRGQPFQTNRSFRKISGWVVEICLFHSLSVWNNRNFHVNGKQPRKHLAHHEYHNWEYKKTLELERQLKFFYICPGYQVTGWYLHWWTSDLIPSATCVTFTI
jgi:hypothetical protein